MESNSLQPEKESIISNIFRRFLPKNQPKRKPQEQFVSPEKTNQLEAYIKDGLGLIKEGKFQEAIDYFKNTKMAESSGIDYDPAAKTGIIAEAPTIEEAREIADTLAKHSHSDPIKIVDVFAEDLVQVPEELYHNLALVAAEEWTHELLRRKGYRDNLPSEPDTEIIVTKYFYDQGVPLTEAFLDRYNRN